MAATIGKVWGYNRNGLQSKPATRLGHDHVVAQANTWRTFTTCSVDADGSGYIKVTRGDEELCYFEFGPEEKQHERT